MNKITNTSLTYLADQLITSIKNRSDFFVTKTIVFPNLKTASWFRAYYLKKEKDILMNVKFETLNNILESLFYSEQRYKVVKNGTLTLMIIKVITSGKGLHYLGDEYSSYIKKDDGYDSIKLYDFAYQLANLYLQYDKEKVILSGWQKDIYELLEREFALTHLAPLSYIYNHRKGFTKNYGNLTFFGFSKLEKLEEEILNDYSSRYSCEMYWLANDETKKENFSISSAPSKLREIELLHSKICNILSSDKEATLSDFLVVSNNIGEYENDISRVFRQDNKDFPNIRYCINSHRNVDTDTTFVINKLVEILKKGFFTRLDFFDLINNKTLGEIRNISHEEIAAFTDAILDMNVYRNRDNNDDWDYAKKRMLLSKIASMDQSDDFIVSLNDKDYIPYANISLDNDAIVKFVKTIDDLQKWLSSFKNAKVVDSASLEEMESQLSTWLSNPDENGFEQNKQFNNALKVINCYRDLVLTDRNIPLDTLLYSLIDSSRTTSMLFGECFTSGVTFADLDTSSTLSAKYVFYLGASSNNLPSIKTRSEIDLRNKNNDYIEEQRNAFFLLGKNAEHFYISYVNKDLSSDEDFFPSIFLYDLFINRPKDEDEMKKYISSISIDEDRSWNELYTRKEYKSKDYFQGLFPSDNKSKEVPTFSSSSETLNKVSLSNIADYLSEPLSFMASRLFGRDDIKDEEIREEYEPFTFSNIDKAAVVKELIRNYLSTKKENINSEENTLIEYYDLEHRLPNITDQIKAGAFTVASCEAKQTINVLQNLFQGNYEVVSLEQLQIMINKKPVVFYGDQQCCVSSFDKTRRYLQIKRTEAGKGKDVDTSPKALLKLYAFSLLDIASRDDNDTYNIEILGNGDGYSATYTLNKKEAIDYLTRIYFAMNNFSKLKYMPINSINNPKVDSYDALMDTVGGQGGAWEYFDNAKLFDLYTQLGYENKDFMNEFNSAKNVIFDLVKFIKPVKPQSEGGEENE